MSLRITSELIHVIVNSSSNTIALVAAVPTKRVGIFRVALVVGGATTVTFQDTAGVALSGPYSMAANGSITLDVSSNMDSWWNSSTGFGVQLVQNSGQAIGGDVWCLQGP
jgi:hypothetical protein